MVRRVAHVGIVLATFGCTPEPDPTDSGEDPPAVGSWAPAFADEVGALSGVWGSGPDDVWMVGGDADSAEIWHFDGAAWASVPAPDVGLLVWVYGFGPDDAVAVGVHGAVARWDGTAWTARDPGTAEDLWGVWGNSPTDLWIVGGDPTDGDPVILRYDGDTTFTPVALDPSQNDRLAHALFKVWGIDGRTFAVGQGGLVVEWDGDAWIQHPAGPSANADFVSLWGTSADHVVVVGGRASARVATFDGTSFTTTEPLGPGLSAVSMGTADEVVVGGSTGWVGRYDLGTGELVAETPVDTTDVHALWFDGVDRYYGVAGHFTEPYFGTPLVRTVEAR